MPENHEKLAEKQKKLRNKLKELEEAKQEREETRKLRNMLKKNLEQNKEIADKIDRLTTILREAAQEEDGGDLDKVMETIASSQIAIIDELTDMKRRGPGEGSTAELQNKLDSLNEALQDLPEKMKMDTFKKELDSLDEKITTISKELSEEETSPRLETITEDLKSLQNQLNKLSTEIKNGEKEELGGRIDQLLEKIDEAQKVQLPEKSGEIQQAELEERLADISHQIEELKKAEEKKKEQTGQEGLEEVRNMLKNIEKSLQEKEGQKPSEGFEKSVKDLYEKIDSLDKQLDDIERISGEETKQYFQAMSKDLSEIEKTLDDVDEYLKEAHVSEGKMKETREKIKEARKSVEKAKKEKPTEEKVSNLKKSVSSTEVPEARKVRDRTKEKMEKAREKMEKVREKTQKGTTCQVCGEDFDTERGMKIHKSQVHDDEESPDEKVKELEEKLSSSLKKMEEHEEKHGEVGKKAEEVKKETEEIAREKEKKLEDYLEGMEKGKQVKVTRLSKEMNLPEKKLMKMLKEKLKGRKDIKIENTGMMDKVKGKKPLLVRKGMKECTLCGKEFEGTELEDHLKEHLTYRKIAEVIDELPPNKEIDIKKTAEDLEVKKPELVEALKAYSDVGEKPIDLLDKDRGITEEDPVYFVKKE